MNSQVYFAAFIADAIASCVPDEELPYVAALLTSVADQIALILVCREAGENEAPLPVC